LPIHDRIRQISERSVWVTQLVFGLVLAKGLVLYKELVLHPIGPNRGNLLATLGLFTVYYTTLLSWLDFSRTIARKPYDYATPLEKCRFLSDVAIVILYAYLLFSVEYLLIPRGDITRFLVGFVFIYVGYLLSGLLRIRTYGRIASRWKAIVLFGLLFLLVLLAYQTNLLLMGPSTLLNYLAVLGCFILVLLYRALISLLSQRRKKAKESGFRIGVDVDGVLANQIQGLLPMIKEKYNKDLTYDEIIDWRLPIGDSSIDKEIVAEQEKKDFVLGMALHKGARGVLSRLQLENIIIIVTARKGESDVWTQEWLRLKRVPFDNYVNACSSCKSEHNFDILIDDYLMNIERHLSNTGQKAILFDQPWNRNRSRFQSWIDDKRLLVAINWTQVEKAVKQWSKQRTEKQA